MNGWVSHYFPVDTVWCDYVAALSSSTLFIYLFGFLFPGFVSFWVHFHYDIFFLAC